MKVGLDRDIRVRRTRSDYRLDRVIAAYRDTRDDPYATSKVLDVSFAGLIQRFGDAKDIREITSTEAKQYPKWLKRRGRSHGGGELADSTVAKRVERIKSMFLWATAEGIVPRSVFSFGVRTKSTPQKHRQYFVGLNDSEMFFNSQDNLQNLALAVLARFLGVRPASDCVWLRNQDIDFADGDCSRATVKLDSVKTGGRTCPLFSDAAYVILKLLCDREPRPDGFLIKGPVWDAIRDPNKDVDTSSLSLSTQFRRRFMKVHGKNLWPKPFVNTRSTLITELNKVFGYNQHSIGIWLGNSPQIQNQHYLQLLDDDHREAMQHWRNGKKGSQKGSHTGGSYWYAMVRRALKRVCPELVANAEQHAAGITKIGLNGMFESVEVPSEEEPSVLSRGGLSSGGGTRTPDTRIMIPML